jgi:hypothetical protein
MIDPEAGKFHPVVPLASTQFVSRKFHLVVLLAEVMVHVLFRILN